MVSTFKIKNLEELHLSGFDIYLKKFQFKIFLVRIAENMPKLQLFCLMAEVEFPNRFGEWDEYAKICQAFASEKNIKLEIRDNPILCNFDCGIKSICCGHYRIHPSKVVKIYSPK